MIIGRFFLFLLPFFLQAETPFLLLTIPKSGSYLAVNLMQALSCKKGEFLYMPGADFNEIYPGIFQQGTFYFYHYRSWKHFRHQEALFKKLKLFVNVRDPRDVCISSAFFFKKELDQLLGKEASFHERLSYVIQTDVIHDGMHDFFGPAAFFENIFRLMESFHPTLLYYEDLVGPRGGGSKERQIAAIQKIGVRIGIFLTDEQAGEVGETIYGGTLTFRDGHIGSWKKHFTEEHKQLFKRTSMNQFLIHLGYETDSNW